MAYALNQDLRTPLRSLVSVDMSPAVGKISPEYVFHLTALKVVG